MLKTYNESKMESYSIDIHTKNTSFIKMAFLLQRQGIKNYHFMLKILDTGLIGVDPYDPDLDKETMTRIIRECALNRWYFYREVYRIPVGGAGVGIGGGSEFILNRGNMAYLWAMEMNLSTIMILPRQIGKTWAGCADFAWTHQFNRGSTLLHFNKTQKDANDNLRRVTTSLKMLPRYLQHSNTDFLDAQSKRGIKNNEKTIINRINSTIEAMASAGNEAKADTMARGKTAQKIWCDEFAFLFYNSIIYPAVVPAFERAREVAMRYGAPYAFSITTTPGDLATPHGAYCYAMINNSIRFSESMYDMKRKKLDTLVNNSPDKMPFIYIEFDYRQLGETDEWYRKRFKKILNPLLARREYLLEWINTNGNSPFDPDDVDAIGVAAKRAEERRQTVRLNKYYELNIYDEYNGSKPVIIGVDVAGDSIGRDNSAIVVVNPDNLRPMAVFKSNMIESSRLRKIITSLIKKYYPHCILTIENNNTGGPLISELRENPFIARMMYKEKKIKTVDYGVNAVNRKKKRESLEWGHNTNSVTRPQMMETLESMVHNYPGHLGIPELYEEIKYLEIKNGRIDHNSATHDDVVMAYMGALWIIKYGTGLKGKGIYFNLDDGLDNDQFEQDLTEQLRFATNLLRKQQRQLYITDPDDEIDDDAREYFEYMTTPAHDITINEFDRAEREETLRLLDSKQGVLGLYDTDSPDEFRVDPEVNDEILRNYNTAISNGQFLNSGLFNPNTIMQQAQSSLVDMYKY